MHRVYVHDEEVWTLASNYGRPLSPDAEYVVFETDRPPSVQEVCVLLDDGRRLCDLGPDHVHGD